jgi:hypothetical protein
VIACFAASCARPARKQHSSIALTKPLRRLIRFMDRSPLGNESIACDFMESWMMSRI